MTEKWAPILGYEGWYSVSSLGRVRRDRRGIRTRVGTILKPTLTGRYPRVSLSCGPGVLIKGCMVHRLVAAAFLGPCPTDYVVNHRDGNKSNNAAENLEYVTSQENSAHAQRTGLRPFGENHPNAKLSSEAVVAILASGLSDEILARQYGVHSSAISHVRNRRNWRHIKGSTVPLRGRGELRADSKLTTEAVRIIRSSPLSNIELATLYGVTRGAIISVKRRQTWAHI